MEELPRWWEDKLEALLEVNGLPETLAGKDSIKNFVKFIEDRAMELTEEDKN